MFEVKLSTVFENTFKNKHLEGSHVIFMSHICTKYKGSLELSGVHLFQLWTNPMHLSCRTCVQNLGNAIFSMASKLNNEFLEIFQKLSL